MLVRNHHLAVASSLPFFAVNLVHLVYTFFPVKEGVKIAGRPWLFDSFLCFGLLSLRVPFLFVLEADIFFIHS